MGKSDISSNYTIIWFAIKPQLNDCMAISNFQWLPILMSVSDDMKIKNRWDMVVSWKRGIPKSSFSFSDFPLQTIHFRVFLWFSYGLVSLLNVLRGRIFGTSQKTLDQHIRKLSSHIWSNGPRNWTWRVDDQRQFQDPKKWRYLPYRRPIF